MNIVHLVHDVSLFPHLDATVSNIVFVFVFVCFCVNSAISEGMSVSWLSDKSPSSSFIQFVLFPQLSGPSLFFSQNDKSRTFNNIEEL